MADPMCWRPSSLFPCSHLDLARQISACAKSTSFLPVPPVVEAPAPDPPQPLPLLFLPDPPPPLPFLPQPPTLVVRHSMSRWGKGVPQLIGGPSRRDSGSLSNRSSGGTCMDSRPYLLLTFSLSLSSLGRRQRCTGRRQPECAEARDPRILCYGLHVRSHHQ